MSVHTAIKQLQEEVQKLIDLKSQTYTERTGDYKMVKCSCCGSILDYVVTVKRYNEMKEENHEHR